MEVVKYIVKEVSKRYDKIYSESVLDALIYLWYMSDYICSKLYVSMLYLLLKGE